MPLRVFMAVSNDNIGGRGRLRQPGPTSAAGDSFAARADLCHQYSLSPVESLTPANSLSLMTFFPGVDDTGQK